MAFNRPRLTRSGYDELQRELKNLEERRRALANDLQEILTETGEDEALDFDAQIQRERLDERISYLRHILANPIIIEGDEEPGAVSLGNIITVSDDEGEEMRLTVLSKAEVSNGKRGIADDSPVGKALMGRKVGDTVPVETPDGTIHYTIKAIE
jgi:transcription elongation factor GreA